MWPPSMFGASQPQTPDWGSSRPPDPSEAFGLLVREGWTHPLPHPPTPFGELQATRPFCLHTIFIEAKSGVCADEVEGAWRGFFGHAVPLPLSAKKKRFTGLLDWLDLS